MEKFLIMQENDALLPELEVDVREECVKFGPVDNVKVIINFTRILFVCHNWKITTRRLVENTPRNQCGRMTDDSSAVVQILARLSFSCISP
jgi:hypothetical protein